jgi:hypothetical protein
MPRFGARSTANLRGQAPVALPLHIASFQRRRSKSEELLRSARAERLTPEQVMVKLRELAPGSTAHSDLPVMYSERTTRG